MTPEQAWNDIEAWQKSQRGLIVVGNGDRDDRAASFEQIMKHVNDTDRQWFVQHPGEDHYVREAFEGEWPPPPPGVHRVLVMVTSVMSGLRTRRPMFE